MNDYKIKLGRLGEIIAARFLEKNGFKVIDRNFYTRYGEIDLIAENGDEILFCEVKARTSSEYGYPEQAVDYYKIRKILKAIGVYLQARDLNKFWRLDVISVEMNKADKKAKVKWFKNVGIDN